MDVDDVKGARIIGTRTSCCDAVIADTRSQRLFPRRSTVTVESSTRSFGDGEEAEEAKLYADCLSGGRNVNYRLVYLAVRVIKSLAWSAKWEQLACRLKGPGFIEHLVFHFCFTSCRLLYCMVTGCFGFCNFHCSR